ncbi:HYR domain-containing protein [Marinirhabdus gelatinilytica]|uniref:Putative secreted protein (Por secretion system target) n=1 Tax=Marinirhabdus gelatinilytica TaxID=1703343 RepID=A0A370Q965_9FLAO|nr:HYR domain-containing protein [Marinirhabdus gelatinilytica]RDK84904.1 putative secreted protein (Por secretion system target) [Marinirhabdus gelatinilytica]
MKKKLHLLSICLFLIFSFQDQSAHSQCNSANYNVQECGQENIGQQNYNLEIQSYNPNNLLPPGDTFYIHSVAGNSWGETVHQTAMDQAFGVGNWTEEFFETLDPAVVFAPTSRIAFIDGSDTFADELNTFLMGNLPALETWVSGGGILLLNSAPNEGGNINFGFGGSTLVYSDPSITGASNVEAPNPAHPVLLGPFLPTSPTMSGNFYSHSNITGTGFTNILVETGNPTETMLVEKAFGSGFVLFGGFTTNNFHTPSIEAKNFTANLLVYLESLYTGGSNPPVITCPADVTITAPAGSCDADYTFTFPPASDPDGGTVTVIQTMGPPSPGPFPVGTTVLEFTATNDDAPNETATCQYTVTVLDNEAPSVSCPGDQNESFDANCTFVLPDYTGLASATDTCDPAPTVTQSPPSGTVINATSAVTVTATDSSGNSDSCTFNVILTDDTPPLLVCPVDQNESVDASCMFTIPDYSGMATASDNCGTITFTQTPPMGTMVPVGTTSITLDVSDGNNTSSCSFNIIVEDTTAPLVSCQNITVQLDANGMASITPADIVTSSSDNCGIASTVIDIDSFDCSDVGLTQVTATVTDTSGNSSICTSLITIEDNIAPMAVCQDITVQLSEGTVEIEAIDVDGGSTDACGIQSRTIDIDTFDCSNIGPNNVVLTIIDENGNSSSCTAVVTVEETIMPPLAVCQNITVPLLPDGTAIIPASSLDGGSMGIGCTGTVSVNIDTFDCSDIGDPIEVVFTVTNANGVSDSCTAFVNVVDGFDPTIECPDDQFVTSTGPYELPDYLAIGDVVVADNCLEFTTVVQDPPPGTLMENGSYNILFTATDPSLNEASCSFVLTVNDILGTEDFANALGTLTLYPNPAGTVVNLSNPNLIDLDSITIYDMAGRTIQTIPLTETTSQKRIGLSGLASASYIVVISSPFGQITKQLIKE